MNLLSIEGWTNILLTITVVMMIDKFAFNDAITKHRKWILPMLSLFIGIVTVWSKSHSTISVNEIVYNGIFVGSFASTFYKTIKEGYKSAVEAKISNMNIGDDDE